jgi:hypothetical protein
MKTYIETINQKHYVSSVLPEIDVTADNYAKVIEWADATPNVWAIVRGNKSAHWGRNSSTYVAYGRGESAEGACHRASVLMAYATLGRASEAHGVPESDLFGWSARFTIEHYKDKGFRGGFFQQFDGQYQRGCISLDYTPSTLDLVIDRFVDWCGKMFTTREVWIDKKVVRRVSL